MVVICASVAVYLTPHTRPKPQAGGGPTAAVVDVIPRSREVGQSWLTSNFTTLRALAPAAGIVLRRRPRLLLVNGPGTCIPVCAAAFVFRRAPVQGCGMRFLPRSVHAGASSSGWT